MNLIFTLNIYVLFIVTTLKPQKQKYSSNSSRKIRYLPINCKLQNVTKIADLYSVSIEKLGLPLTLSNQLSGQVETDLILNNKVFFKT